MAGRESGRGFGIDFDRAAGRPAAANGSEGVANDSDGVLGTEAGKFHEGASNLAHRNAAANGNFVRGEG